MVIVKSVKTEVTRTVMCDMRRLASLFICFLEECRRLNGSHTVEVKDMVRHSNFPALNKLAKIVKSTYFVS